MKVRELGFKEVYCAGPAQNLSEVAAMMKRHDIGVVPVCEGRQLLGMITDRDIVVTCVASGMNPSAYCVREFMTASPVSVGPETGVEDAARLMAREQVRRLPVTENGDIVGIISLGDVAAALTGNPVLAAETLRRVSAPARAVLT